jgi:dihydroxyacetone kinase
MSTKHFYPSSTHTQLLTSSLYSAPLLNPSLSISPTHKVVYYDPVKSQSDLKYTPVSIISGGGSGHEPSFTGFVGQGLLSASVAGTIFASPSAKQVEWAVRKLANLPRKTKGVVAIVMNYTGDILNFGLGISRVAPSIVPTKMVVVADDVGVPRSALGEVGRRGIAGTVLVLKIVGGLARHSEFDASMEEVEELAKLVADNVISVGASLGHVHVPGSKPSRVEGEGDWNVEIGMGIHNEAGSENANLGIEKLVAKMLSHLLDQNDKERAFLKISSSEEVVLLVNNLGGISVLEFTAVVSEVVGQLAQSWNIRPARILAGTFMTSLNGMGFSISLLKVVDTGWIDGLSMLSLLAAPTEAVGWPAGGCVSESTWKANASKRRSEGKDDDSLLQEVVQTSNIQGE